MSCTTKPATVASAARALSRAHPHRWSPARLPRAPGWSSANYIAQPVPLARTSSRQAPRSRGRRLETMAVINVLVADIGDQAAQRRSAFSAGPPSSRVAAVSGGGRAARPAPQHVKSRLLAGGTNCRFQVWQLDKHLRPSRMVLEQVCSAPRGQRAVHRRRLSVSLHEARPHPCCCSSTPQQTTITSRMRCRHCCSWRRSSERLLPASLCALLPVTRSIVAPRLPRAQGRQQAQGGGVCVRGAGEGPAVHHDQPGCGAALSLLLSLAPLLWNAPLPFSPFTQSTCSGSVSPSF